MDFFRRLLPILLLFLSKMLHLSRRNFTFSQLEEQVADATRWPAREGMTLLLEQIDIELMEARDTRKWRLGYAKTRSILTLFGGNGIGGASIETPRPARRLFPR